MTTFSYDLGNEVRPSDPFHISFKSLAYLCDLFIKWIRKANMANHTLFEKCKWPNSYYSLALNPILPQNAGPGTFCTINNLIRNHKISWFDFLL